MKLAVYTPTYNRADELQLLYNSLVEQTNKDFFWLIIDDGSTDDTEEKVNEWQKSSVFKIIYLKKENGGKHTAINKALDIVDNYWNLCVDSDDWFISNGAIQKKKNDIDECINREEIISLVYPLQLSGKKVRKVNHKPMVIKDCDARNKKLNVTEVTIVSRPHAYKEIRFPIFKGERFIAEDAIEIPKLIDKSRIYINDPVVEGKYLSDGLTNNILLYWKQNPKGYYYVRNIKADFYKREKQFIKMMRPLGQIVAFNYDNKNPLLYKISNKIIGAFSIPFGLIYWKRKFIRK